MNREIKFRGKAVDSGLWVTGNAMFPDDELFNTYIIPKRGATLGKHIRVIPETVGQFTGLRDKDGKEIYEGDVIANDEFPHFLLVGYNYDAASFCGSKTNNFNTENCYWFYNDIVMTDGWVVISNIYDNPELIK